MRQIPAQLCRALGAGTAHGRAVLIPHHLGAAHRAGIREEIGLCIHRAAGLVHLENLRDNLACFADFYGIADADVLIGDEVLVVEGGIGDGGTGQAHRHHHGLGRQDAGASHLHHNVLYHSLLDLRRIFEGRRPARELRGAAQPRPSGEIVDLDDRAVNVKGKVTAVRVNGLHQRFGLGGIGAQPVGNHLKMEPFEVIQGLRVGGKGHPLHQLEVENENIQLPCRRHLGIQLAQRAGRQIAGIGVERLAPLLPLLVEGKKYGFGHEHLAADNEAAGRAGEPKGNGADGL